MTKKLNVVVLGASSNPDRYSYQAVDLLEQKGYNPIPVNPKEAEVLGHTCFANLESVKKEFGESIDTLTMYVNEDLSTKMERAILNLKPKRIIFNPGAENPMLEARAQQERIETLNACTLVLLRTKQF